MPVKWFAFALLAYTACATVRKDKPVSSFTHVSAVEWTDRTATWIDLSPDATHLLLASEFGKVSVYAGPAARRVDHAAGDSLMGAGFLDDGRIFVAAPERLTIWNEDFSRQLGDCVLPRLTPDLPRRRAALSPSRRYLAVDDAVYDTEAKRWALPRIGHGEQTALAFGDDSFVLTAGFHDRQVVVRQVNGNEKHLWKAAAPVIAAALTSGGKLAVVATKAGVATWIPTDVTPSHDHALSGIRDLQLCSQERFAVVLQGHTVRVLNLPALDLRAALEMQADGSVIACDGDLLAAGDESGRLYAWELSTNRLLAEERLLRGPVSTLRVSRSRNRMLAVANDEQGAHARLVQLR